MPKLLLIDDKSDNLTSLAATILSFIPEANILKALSGQEGFNAAISELPDVILLDIRMPYMDGFEVLDILKSNLKTKIIPVILITANHADVYSKIKGLENGADSFLTKPIESSELIAQIKVMLRIKQAEDQLRDEKVNLETLVDERTASLKKEMAIREQKEIELKESELRFRQVSESANEWIWEVDKNGLYTYASKLIEDLLGYKVDELVGKKYFYDFFDPANKEELKQTAFDWFARKKKLIDFINVNIHKNGKKVILSTTAIPILDNGNNLIGYRGVDSDITEHILAEEKIREKEIQFRKLSSNLPDLIFQFTKRTDGTYCVPIASEGIKNIFGCSPEDVKNDFSPIARVIHPEDTERVISDIEYSAKNLTYFACEFRVQIPGKPIQWILSRSTPEKLSDGSVTWYGFNANITERKLSEEKLKTTNEFNESLINTIPFGFDIVDMDGNILFINNILKDAVGLENPQKKCWEVYKDNRKQCTDCPLKGELKLGDTNICDIIGVLGGRQYEVTHTVMNYKGQKAMLEIFRDITEERKAEKRIKQLSQGIEQSAEMIIITDIKGNIEYANPHVTEVTGYSQEELIGKNTSLFKSNKTSKKTYQELWETILQGKVWKGDILNKRKNGEVYWESESISPIINNEGEIINFIANKQDITEKIKSMEELIEAKERAVQSDKLKTEFLAQMSHEIRSPMGAIISFTSILRDELTEKITPDLMAYFNGIDSAGNRLIRTVDMILNSSELQVGTYDPIFTEIDLLGEIVKMIEVDFTSSLTEKGLKYNLISNIEEAVIYGDKYSISQMFKNLLDNAIKYTKHGSITVKVEKDKKLIKVSIKDTGIGMSEEYLPKIFMPFNQEDRGYSRNYEGNGLGLSLVKKYCDLNGITIEVESKKEVGTKFTLVFTEIK